MPSCILMSKHVFLIQLYLWYLQGMRYPTWEATGLNAFKRPLDHVDYFTTGRWAKYCDRRVCLSVCPLAYPKTHMSKFRIFCTRSHGSVLWRTFARTVSSQLLVFVFSFFPYFSFLCRVSSFLTAHQVSVPCAIDQAGHIVSFWEQVNISYRIVLPVLWMT